MNYQQWELDHAAINVANNTNLRKHEKTCAHRKNRDCNCPVRSAAKLIIKNSWEMK